MRLPWDSADRLGDQAGPVEQEAMTQANLTSLRFEHMFWDMAHNLESWSV